MNQNIKVNTRNQILMIVAVLLVGLMVAGGTYAFWLWRGNIADTNVVVELPNLGLTLDGGTTTISGLAPASCKSSRFAAYSAITIKRHNETRYPAYVVLKLSLNSFTWTQGSTKPSTQLASIRFAVSSYNRDSINSTCSNAGTLANNTSSTAVSQEILTYSPAITVATNEYIGSLSGINAGTKNTPVTNQNKRLLTWIYEIPANSGTKSSEVTETYYIYYWIDKDYVGVAADPTVFGSGTSGIVDPLQDISFTISWSAAEIIQVQDLTTVTSYTGV